jgi:hypothetical protein
MALDTGHCRQCSAEIITGRSDGPTAWDVTVDAAPLDPLGELAAAVAGCWTWTLHTRAGQLYLRSPATIRTRPAGTRPRQTVHADHRCPTLERTPPR